VLTALTLLVVVTHALGHLFATLRQPPVIGEILGEAPSGRDGLDALGGSRGHPGELSLPRAHEIAAAINRVRSLKAGTSGGA
jgi:hypothetical protein